MPSYAFLLYLGYIAKKEAMGSRCVMDIERETAVRRSRGLHEGRWKLWQRRQGKVVRVVYGSLRAVLSWLRSPKEIVVAAIQRVVAQAVGPVLSL